MSGGRLHALAFALLAAFALVGLHQPLKTAITDARFLARAETPPSQAIVVAVDGPSIEQVGTWPWPREVHAALISRLHGAGASEIAFDVDFSSLSTPSSDQALAAAFKQVGGSVILPTFRQWAIGSEGRKVQVNRPAEAFRDLTWSASVTLMLDPDGIVRRYPLGDNLDGEFTPSLGALLAGQHVSTRSSFVLDFSIPVRSVPVVSAGAILRGDPQALAAVRGKKAIVGGTAIELGDRFNIPTGRLVPGVYIHALAVETLMQGRTLHSAGAWAAWAAVFAVIALVGLAWRRRSAAGRALLVVALALSSEAAAWVLHHRLGIILDTSLVHLAAIFYLVAIGVLEIKARGLLRWAAERRFHRVAMSLGEGLACLDENGVVTVWNNEAARILGYRADEMIGRSLSERFTTPADGNPFDLTGYAPRVLPESGGITLELIGRRRSGGTFPVEASLSAWRGIKGRQYALLFRDVSTRKEQEARIRFLAERDSLTGLANRNTLDLHLAQTMAEPAGDVALLVVGIDRFKQVNDTLGHSCGDMLLCALAERLTVMAADSMVARLSGDEFAVVVAGLRSVERAEALIAVIESEFDGRPMSVGPRELRVRVSLGLAVAPRDGKTPEELLGNADMALYRAKLAGRSRCVAFDRAMREQLEKRASLEEALASAAERGEFVLYYQPQINLTTGRLAGAEALIRWRHPERGLIMPAEFMPVANASTLSDRIAEWVLTQSMRQAAEWHRAGNPVRVGVNVAPSQLLGGGFAEQVEALLRVTELPPHLLELEITEDILLAEEEATLATFRRLRELGVHIAFDDFGTGYASLTSLKRFPLNRVKIDKSFVLDLKAGSADAAIVGSTISLSKTLGLEVIAEGVESRDVATLLHDMGCDEAQGFYFGRATTADQLQERYFKAAARNTRSLAASAA